MQKKTHLLFGILFGMILLYLGFPFNYIILIAFSAYIPDLDFLLDKVWLKPKGFIKRNWKKLTGKSGLHRRIFHNIWFGIVYALIVGYFTQWSLSLILLAFIGFLSHLLIDSLTYTGVYWLWPIGEFIGKKDFLYFNGKFITGSKEEEYLRYLILLLSSALFSIYLMKDMHVKNIVELIIVFMFVFYLSILFTNKIERYVNKLTNKIFLRKKF